ncbi:MAG: NTPase [Candidatus Helarchaeota archaeon]|nr:NTPase [Candidatus Helarchaeota archaeon]
MKSKLNILIRGKPQSGKSTLIQKLVELLRQMGKTIGGISTPELREGRSRVGFEIVDMMTGERGILSHIDQKEGPRISRYRVNLKDLNDIGVRGIKQALEKNADLIIIDEIGKMELFSKEFQAVIWEALNLQKVLGTIGQISHAFITKIYQREDLKVINLTSQNRDAVFEELSANLQNGNQINNV